MQVIHRGNPESASAKVSLTTLFPYPPPSPSLFWGFVNSRGETLKGVWYFGTLPADTGGTEHPASGLWSRWQELSVPMYADVRNIYDSLHSFRCNHRPTRCTLRKAAKSMTGPTISMTQLLRFWLTRGHCWGAPTPLRSPCRRVVCASISVLSSR